MHKLQQLWQIAESMDIFVDFHDLGNRCIGLLGLYMPQFPGIALDFSLENNIPELKCVFAEEIGHAKTLYLNGWYILRSAVCGLAFEGGGLK